MRDATEADAEALLAIYNHEVTTGVATLDLEPRTLAGQIEWIRRHQGANPVVVAEIDDDVVGFASLTQYKERAAYRTTVENSIYVAPGMQGRGIGNALLGEIVDRARLHGFHSVIARIAGDNQASIALHTRHGYELVGVEREVGRKFGRWLDVTELQLLL
ncbi:MAG: N-acetyltransferase family protein [Actinomycetota bacterium]